jgi:hypothetical protein
MTGPDDHCMFCGALLASQGEEYYDHLRTQPGCGFAWKAWKEDIVLDHPGGD